MFDVVLYEPEIPPNTGNIIRLCANMGARLHLIEPLGFLLDDKRLRRAGLDYREFADVRLFDNYASFLADRQPHPDRIFACSTKGSQPYAASSFERGDVFVFGPETRGLGQNFLESVATSRRICIPMQPGSRSLNLSNAVSIVLYEAWRQNGFLGSAS